MKHLIYISLLFLASFTACGRHTVYPSAMQQAEELMNTRPDSALTLLEAMVDTLAMLPEETRMYHQLLTIQAKDKLYITHTSDSLINRIVAFYEAYGNSDRLMMAYFYQGSTYRDMNDAPRALKAFHQAIDAGKNTENLTLLGQTYGQMGSLLAKHELYDDAMEAHKQSLYIYEKQKEHSRTPLVMRNIARIYDIKEINDSAILFYNQALLMSTKKGNTKSSNNIISELGCLYYEVGEKTKAKQMLSQLQGHPSTICNALLYLGIIHKEENRTDSAIHFLNQVLAYGDLNKRCSAHKYLWQIETNSENEQKSKLHKKQYLLLRDSIEAMRQKEKTEKTHLTHNYKRIQKNYKTLHKERTFFRNHLILTWIFIFVIGVAIPCIWTFIIKKRKRRLETKTTRQNTIMQTETFILFQKASQNGSTVSNSDWEELQTQIKEYLPEYYTHLSEKKSLFNLSLHEIKICHLTKLGFSNRDMAKILLVTESAISHAKIRLYKRIKNEKGTSAKFLDFIEEL